MCAVCARLWCLLQLLLFTSKFSRSQWLPLLNVAGYIQCFFLNAFQFTIFHPSSGKHTQTSTKHFFSGETWKPFTVQILITPIKRKARRSRIILLARHVRFVIVATFTFISHRIKLSFNLTISSEMYGHWASLLSFRIVSFLALLLSWPWPNTLKLNLLDQSCSFNCGVRHARHKCINECDAFTDKNYNHRNSLDPLGDSCPCTIFHFVHSQCKNSIKFPRQAVCFFPFERFDWQMWFCCFFIRSYMYLMSNKKMPVANVFGRERKKMN